MKIYKNNIKLYDAKLLQISKVLNRISFLRLFIFLISGIIIIYLFSLNLIIPALIVLPLSIACFGLAITYHTKIAFLKKHTAFLKSINESEISRGKCELEEFDTGHEFINANHSYTSDLDIFGQHSVFQLVNRTTTETGRMLLSEWLSEAASNDEILDRQKAIKELSHKLEWRQEFEASGLHFQNKKSDYNKLLDWVKSPVVLLQKRRIYVAAAITLSLLSLLSLSLFVINLISPYMYIYLISFTSIMFVNYLVLRNVKSIADDIVVTSTENLNTLRAYQTLINTIEIESFKSEKLQDLQSILVSGKYSASSEIKRICGLLDFSHQRSVKKNPIGGNYFYSILNSFLLLDIYLILGTEKWKTKNKALLEPWSEVVCEFEVLNSFAGFSYSNPSYTFPELEEKDHYIYFESLGHPLISTNLRVCNTFRSEGQGSLSLITGSNMGGKSTFLRTVGVNLILALAGAPCCAKYGQVSNMKLFTSMRTQDNLKEGISSFYAELGRIEKMLKLILNSNNVFLLLDEMFKGTNSEDRHRGGFSLINQITKLKTSGIIATHDIELAKLSEHKMELANYSFNSEIKDHSMIFSYKLHPGICNDFNASELMEKSGIQII